MTTDGYQTTEGAAPAASPRVTRRKTARPWRRAVGQSAFSNGELVAALAVLGIAALGTLPSLSVMIQSASLSGTTREILVQLERARADAIMRNSRCRVELDDRGQMALYRYDSTHLDWDDTPALTVKPGREGGVALEATGAIVFEGNGTAQRTASIVVRSFDGRTRTISVGAAGSIRIL